MTCFISSAIGEDDSGMIQLLSAISQPQRVLKSEDMQIIRLYSLSLFSWESIGAQFSHSCTKADVKNDGFIYANISIEFYFTFGMIDLMWRGIEDNLSADRNHRTYYWWEPANEQHPAYFFLLFSRSSFVDAMEIN